MHIVRLLEDYAPDATAHIIPKQVLYKKDLLIQVYPAKNGWVIVKPLQSTTSDPSWVPERLIKPASPGLYRARSDVSRPHEFGYIPKGDIVMVVDIHPIYIPHEWTNRYREGWWKVQQLDDIGHIYYCAPSSLEAVDILENPPRDPSATKDIGETPSRDPIAITSQISGDSLSERNPPSPGPINHSKENPSSPGLIKSLINSVLRRKPTIIASEAPPPYVDDRKNYAAGN